MEAVEVGGSLSVPLLHGNNVRIVLFIMSTDTHTLRDSYDGNIIKASTIN